MKKYYVYKLDLFKLNILSILLLIIMFLISFFIDRNLLFKSFKMDNYLWFLCLFILYTIFHEILHGLSYVIHGANGKNVTFGACFEKGVFYCLCKQNISKKNILISLIYPLLFIGIITYIISIIFQLEILLLLSICNIGGCIGDIIMFIFILKMDKGIEYSEFDDETSFGIYSDKKINDMFGINYVRECDSLNINDYSKIKISKSSLVIIIIISILGIIDIIL